MKWRENIEIPGKKLSTAVFMDRRKIELANEKTAIATYCSNFHSSISYGFIIWENSPHVD